MVDERFRDRLDGAADAIDVGNTIDALDEVRSTVRRRRRRRGVLGGLGVTALLVGGVATVTTLDGAGGDDVIRSASPTTAAPATTVAAAVSTDSATSAESADAPPAAVPASSPATAAELIDGRPVALPAADGSGFVEWLVPWHNGFLAGGVSYESQPLPTELAPEIVDLFPPEVVELFADGLPNTVDEATRMLNEAGLFDVVANVIAENPDASAAILSLPTAPPRTIVQFTVDGQDWSPVEMTLPDGTSHLDRVVAAGDRLVAVASSDQGFERSVVVVSTTDLITWETQPLDFSRPQDLPAEVDYNVWPSKLAANESGWIVGVEVATWVSFEQFLPADIVEAMMTGSSGYSTSPDGIEVEIDSDTGGAPVRTRFTWDELDIPDDVRPYLDGNPSGSQLWASAFGGTAAKSDDDVNYLGGIVALADQFLVLAPDLRISTDGLAWTAVDVPLEHEYVSRLIPTEDGLLVFTQGEFDVGGVYLVDPSLTEWNQVVIPGAPETTNSPYETDPGGRAVIIDASQRPSPASTVTVEADGFRLAMTSEGIAQSYELVDVESGDVVLSETVNRSARDFAETGPFEHLQFTTDGTGIVVVEPESGETLVVIPQDVIDQAVSDVFGSDDHEEYRPDLWLIAYAGANRWIVDDLDDGAQAERQYFSVASAVNGETMLVAANDGWLRYDLGN